MVTAVDRRDLYSLEGCCRQAEVGVHQGGNTHACQKTGKQQGKVVAMVEGRSKERDDCSSKGKSSTGRHDVNPLGAAWGKDRNGPGEFFGQPFHGRGT
jgi:hypothetical protein